MSSTSELLAQAPHPAYIAVQTLLGGVFSMVDGIIAGVLIVGLFQLADIAKSLKELNQILSGKYENDSDDDDNEN